MGMPKDFHHENPLLLIHIPHRVNIWDNLFLVRLSEVGLSWARLIWSMEQSRKFLSLFSYVNILRSRSPLSKHTIFFVCTLKDSHTPYISFDCAIRMIDLDDFALPAGSMLGLSPEAKEKYSASHTKV